MSAAFQPPGLRDDPIPRTPDRVLGEVEELLARQIESARRGDFESVLGLGRRVDALLAQRAASEPRPDAALRERVKRLHTRLSLILAQQASELADRLSRLRQGKAVVHVYRANSPP